MQLSVILCTYNRAQNLRQALRSLREMTVPEGVIWEVVVIDNNSTDETAQVVQEFRQTSLPLRYIFEGKQGKSHALNTGIKEARGRILAFTDDDCIVAQDWAAAILREFAADSLLVGLGGRVELYNKDDQPVTIQTIQKKLPYMPSNMKQIALIFGCNMAFAKTAFEETGGVDIELGPGTRNEAFEDLDFIYRVYRKGLKIIYCPDVLVYHNHGRKTSDQIQVLLHKYNIGRGAFFCKHIIRGDHDLLRIVYWDTRAVMITLLKSLFSGKPTDRQRRYLQSLLTGIIYGLITYGLPLASRSHKFKSA